MPYNYTCLNLLFSKKICSVNLLDIDSQIFFQWVGDNIPKWESCFYYDSSICILDINTTYSSKINNGTDILKYNNKSLGSFFYSAFGEITESFLSCRFDDTYNDFDYFYCYNTYSTYPLVEIIFDSYKFLSFQEFVLDIIKIDNTVQFVAKIPIKCPVIIPTPKVKSETVPVSKRYLRYLTK